MLTKNLVVLAPIFLIIAFVNVQYFLVRPKSIPMAATELNNLNAHQLIVRQLDELVRLKLARSAFLLVVGVCVVFGSMLVMVQTFDVVARDGIGEMHYEPAMIVLLVLGILSFIIHRYLNLQYLKAGMVLEGLDADGAVNKVIDAEIEKAKD